MKAILLVCLAVLLGACASKPTFVPEEQASATLGGRTAARYLLPSDYDVQADVKIASFGFTEARTKNHNGKKVHAIQLRINVANEGDQPVSLDPRDQIVEGPTGRHGPGFARSNAGELPQIVVPPGSSRTVELYYPVPEELVKSHDATDFDLSWKILVGGVEFTRVTPFHEVAIDPAVAEQEFAEELAYAWSDPYWGPWYGFGGWYVW